MADSGLHSNPSTSNLGTLAHTVRPYSQSPWPIRSVSGLFLASSFFPPHPSRPPIMLRFGFGAIFSGAGYVLSTGDARNGSGISTAWSLIYLGLNLPKTIKRPSGVSLALSGATLAMSVLYGSEYFLLQDRFDDHSGTGTGGQDTSN